MAEEELTVISLRDDFYRDGYYRALVTAMVLLVAIALLISTSLYIVFSKPTPVTFATGDEFRTLLPVPVDQPYLSQPDLIQWVSDVLPKLFTYDFVNFNQEQQTLSQYFTVNGWKNYTDQLKMYADYNTMVNQKLFLNASAAGAPVIVNQGRLPGEVYGWLIQMSVGLSYSSVSKGNTQPIVIQALVVRVPTLNNLAGVAIEKLTVTKGTRDQVISNG